MTGFHPWLIERTKDFSNAVDALKWTFDGVVYNPLSYAWEPHEQYLRQYVHPGAKVFFLGMNPGPFGMAQTGVPFGEIQAVSTWMGIRGRVNHPAIEHPGRPILGFDIARSEISGKRLWGLLRDRYITANNCFNHLAVMNYCPLIFLDAGARAKNITPDKLPKSEQLALESLCDNYLIDVLSHMESVLLIGVGKYAQKKLERVVGKLEQPEAYSVSSIIHPSPGNPAANNGWAEKVTAHMKAIGAWD